MTTLAELVKQKEALEQQIAQIQSEGRSKAIAQVWAIMEEHGLSQADLSGKGPKAAAAGAKVKNPVAVKFQDKQGNKWTGRGLKPKWLTAAIAAGKKLEDFAV